MSIVNGMTRMQYENLVRGFQKYLENRRSPENFNQLVQMAKSYLNEEGIMVDETTPEFKSFVYVLASVEEINGDFEEQAV